MKIDIARPPKLYRYSERYWLERGLKLGEFRLRPATDYRSIEGDKARQDDELVRVLSREPHTVQITVASSGKELKPIGSVTFRSELVTNYLTLCMSRNWDVRMFSEFGGSDACLVIHDPEIFCERFHAAVERELPGWFGIDGPIAYGCKSPLGVAFSKPINFFPQAEWRFSWLPPKPTQSLRPKRIAMGAIEDIAEIISKPCTRNVA